MNKAELQELLASNPLVRHFYCFDEVDSTMSHARRLINGTANTSHLHGTLIVAERQVAGRGRHGRAWNAPAGSSILASIILARPLLPGAADALQLSLLSAAVPVAVCRGLSATLPGARIKYPNDIVNEGRKLGGVLLEAHGGAVVAGFGINCTQELTDFPRDLKMPATSVFLETGKVPLREHLLAGILSELERLLRPELFATAGDEMRSLCETLGKNVVLDVGASEVLQGIARTITPEGMLILETAEGMRQLYTSQVIRTWSPESETPVS